LQRESREPPRLLPNERQHGGSPLYFSSLLLFLKLFFFLFLLFCIFVPGTTKAVSGREESFNCRSLAPDKNLIRKEEKPQTILKLILSDKVKKGKHFVCVVVG
jgi:hypothetical protein